MYKDSQHKKVCIMSMHTVHEVDAHVTSHQSYLGCAAVSRRHYKHFLQKPSSLFGRALGYIPPPQRGEGPVWDEPEEVRVHCTCVGSLCMRKMQSNVVTQTRVGQIHTHSH